MIWITTTHIQNHKLTYTNNTQINLTNINKSSDKYKLTHKPHTHKITNLWTASLGKILNH